MGFLEGDAFISAEEYRASESARVNEEEIVISDLYMAMFKTNSEAMPAAKVATRIVGVSKQSGACAVRFAFVDSGLKDADAKLTVVQNGYMIQFEEGLDLCGSTGGRQITPYVSVVEGYLKDYFGDMYDYMKRESQALQLTG